MQTDWRQVQAASWPDARRAGHVEPMGGLSKALVVLTILLFVVQVVGLWVQRAGTALLPSAPGDAVPWRDLLPVTGFYLAASVVTIPQLIVAVMWMYRAASNIRARGISKTWGPGWAAGIWFIPVVGQALGFFVCRDIWQGTRGQEAGAPLPGWFWAWWVMFWTSIGGGFLAGLLGQISVYTGAPLRGLVMVLTVTSTALYIAAGVLFLRFVLRIRDVQDGVVTTATARPPY